MFYGLISSPEFPKRAHIFSLTFRLAEEEEGSFVLLTKSPDAQEARYGTLTPGNASPVGSDDSNGQHAMPSSGYNTDDANDQSVSAIASASPETLTRQRQPISQSQSSSLSPPAVQQKDIDTDASRADPNESKSLFSASNPAGEEEGKEKGDAHALPQTRESEQRRSNGQRVREAQENVGTNLQSPLSHQNPVMNSTGSSDSLVVLTDRVDGVRDVNDNGNSGNGAPVSTESSSTAPDSLESGSNTSSSAESQLLGALGGVVVGADGDKRLSEPRSSVVEQLDLDTPCRSLMEPNDGGRTLTNISSTSSTINSTCGPTASSGITSEISASIIPPTATSGGRSLPIDCNPSVISPDSESVDPIELSGSESAPASACEHLMVNSSTKSGECGSDGSSSFSPTDATPTFPTTITTQVDACLNESNTSAEMPKSNGSGCHAVDHTPCTPSEAAAAAAADDCANDRVNSPAAPAFNPNLPPAPEKCFKLNFNEYSPAGDNCIQVAVASLSSMARIPLNLLYCRYTVNTCLV